MKNIERKESLGDVYMSRKVRFNEAVHYPYMCSAYSQVSGFEDLVTDPLELPDISFDTFTTDTYKIMHVQNQMHRL